LPSAKTSANLGAFRSVERQQHLVFKSDMAAKLVLKGFERCNRSRNILSEESALTLCEQVLQFRMFGKNG
jgi:hypothetical protein